MDLAAGSHHERQAKSGQLSLANLRKRGRHRGGSQHVLHRPRGHVGGTHATWAASVGGVAEMDQGPPSHRVNRRRRWRLLLVVVAGESQSVSRNAVSTPGVGIRAHLLSLAAADGLTSPGCFRCRDAE